MSATAETSHTVSASAATEPLSTSIDGARLDQPTDAVAMDSMAQSTHNVDASRKVPTEAATVIDRDDAPTEAPVAGSERNQEQKLGGESNTIAPSPSLSSKGKDKDDMAAAPPMVRQESTMAIGPAQDEIKAITPGVDEVGPVCNITLLLTSGSRHPYKINAKYLSRRNVVIPEETEDGMPDPFSISIYTLKELILREWRADWEGKPTSPSSIRLIHFGKLLDDKEPLKKYQFLPDSPNVVHMSIRPPDLDEEEPKSGAKNASSGRGDGQRERSGGCCIIL